MNSTMNMNGAIVVTGLVYDVFGKALSKVAGGLCRWDLDQIEGRIKDHASTREEG